MIRNGKLVALGSRITLLEGPRVLLRVWCPFPIACCLEEVSIRENQECLMRNDLIQISSDLTCCLSQFSPTYTYPKGVPFLHKALFRILNSFKWWHLELKVVLCLGNKILTSSWGPVDGEVLKQYYLVTRVTYPLSPNTWLLSL